MLAGAAMTREGGVAHARSSVTVRAAGAMRGARDGGGLECAVALPRGYHLTRGANSRYEVTPGGARGGLVADDDGAEVTTVRFRVDAPSEAVVRDDAVEAIARAAFVVPGEASDAAVATGTFSVPSFD